MPEPTPEEIESEIALWNNLPGEIEQQLSSASSAFLEQADELLSLDRKLAEMASETLPMLEESLEEAMLELESKLAEKIERFREAVGEWADEVDSMKDVVEESIATAGELSLDSFETSVEELQQFLEDGFVQKIQSNLSGQFENTEALLEDSKEKIFARFDEFIQETREQLEQVLNFLSDSGTKWKESVSKTKDAYTKLVSDIEAVQRQVALITELMDDALSTTGVGLNSAASVLGEVKGILDDIV